MELDFSDTDQPVALKTTTDVALSTRLRNFALNGSTEEVLGRIKSAEAAASAQASGGLTLSYQQEVAVPSPPATTDGQIVDTAVRRLVSDLDANPNQLPPDASKVADELGQFESEHIVLSKKGETNVGVKASFSNGLTYGLDFGKTVTTEQAIAAAKREPHGEFQPWTDCVRGP